MPRSRMLTVGGWPSYHSCGYVFTNLHGDPSPRPADAHVQGSGPGDDIEFAGHYANRSSEPRRFLAEGCCVFSPG